MNIGVDYIGTSAGAVIINDEGKYFLAKRGNKARDDIGKWEFPGGIINFYESRADAVRRIITEKHDFDIEIVKELGVYDVIDRTNKDHWISTTFICRQVNGAPRIVNPEKCAEIGWFSFEDLQRLDLSRITRLNLKDLQKKHVATLPKLF